MSLDTAPPPKANIQLYISVDRHQPFLPESLHESLDQPQTPGADTDQENYNPTSQARLYPVNIWVRALATSMLMKLSGHPRTHIQLYQEPALPANGLAVNPGYGFICQWVGNSQESLETLISPTNEPALALGPSIIPQPATSWIGPTKQKTAASTQGRTQPWDQG